MNEEHSRHGPAESSPHEVAVRGDLQSPHTDAGRAFSAFRVATVKLAPSSDQWKRLRELAWQAMQYKNNFIRAKLIQGLGFQLDPAKEKELRKRLPKLPKNDPAGIEKWIRQFEKGELSSAVKVAAEADAKSSWSRDARRILAGSVLAQWRQNDSLGIHGHRDKESAGIRIEFVDGVFVADMSVQADTCEGGCWMRVPLAPGTETDEYKAPLLLQMVSGKVPIKRATIVFKPMKGKTLLRLAYPVEIYLPPVGQRVATLSELNDGRVLLRSEIQVIDYTHKKTDLLAKKEHFDGIRRRKAREIGRHRGAVRSKKRAFAYNNIDDFSKTYVHNWSHEVVDWCASQGIGKITTLLIGGDWPADRLKWDIKYKAESAGIHYAEGEGASLDDASTERAVRAAAKKAQRQAKKIGDAVRTFAAALK